MLTFWSSLSMTVSESKREKHESEQQGRKGKLSPLEKGHQQSLKHH